MAKRARLMTTEDVLNELELVDNQDDFDVPMMPGSDDEFSDCELDENLEDGNDDSGDEQNTPPSPTQQNMPTPTLPADWSTNLTSVVKPAVQNTYKRCRSRKCIRWHILIFAVFYLFFLLVLSRPSFTSRTPNKDQKTEELFYLLLVQVP